MGKVSKRQRKFLSKKVLPHKKKTIKRAAESNKKQQKSAENGPPQVPPPQRTVKTIPDGVDVTAFLECPWLHAGDVSKSARDACVSPFVPSRELLQGFTSIAPSGSAKACKKRKPSTINDASNNGGKLTEPAIRNMITQAVENSSMDDLLRCVYAFQITQEKQQWSSSKATTHSSHSKTPKGVGRPLLDSAAQAVLVGPQGLGRLHLAFRAHLGPGRQEGSTPGEWEESAWTHRQFLEKVEAWPALGGALLSFLTLALDYLELTVKSRSELEGNRGRHGNTATSVATSANADSKNRARLLEGLALLRVRLPLLFPFPRLARRHLVFLLDVLQTTDDSAVASLTFLRLYELATSQPMPFVHDAFKGIYRVYRAAAERVGALVRGEGASGSAGAGLGAGTAGVLPLLRDCIVELFGVEKPSSYLHAYVYIHGLVREAVGAAAEMRGGGGGGGKIREAGPALRRLRSWSFLQSLQLWAAVVAAHASKTSLGPLVPPLCKALEITLQLSPGVHGAPRTLALARAAQDLAAAAGIFLPTSHYLLSLLELSHPRGSKDDGRSCPTGSMPNISNKGGFFSDGAEGSGDGKDRTEQSDQSRSSDGGNTGSKGGKRRNTTRQRDSQGENSILAGVAGLSKEELRLGPVHSAVSRQAVSLIAREAVCYRWSAGLPDLCTGINARLAKLLEGGCLPGEGGGGRCRARVRWLQGVLEKASAEASTRRASGSKHPGEAGPIDTFRGTEEPTAAERLLTFKETCA